MAKEVIKKEMAIDEILNKHPMIAPVLMASGVDHVGLPASKGRSLAQIAVDFGLDGDDLAARLNEFLVNPNT